MVRLHICDFAIDQMERLFGGMKIKKSFWIVLTENFLHYFSSPYYILNLTNQYQITIVLYVLAMKNRDDSGYSVHDLMKNI